ncbi:MAG: hypothetical protein J5589_08905 [Firmicutes bacterium]|nr:hypothetical protein [Bacillota bacterium]
MNSTFYLDPESVQYSCQTYISRLEEGNESLKRTEDAVLLGSDQSGSLAGEGMEACKTHLAAYKEILSAMITIGAIEIEESRFLSRSVGDELLDGDSLYCSLDELSSAERDARMNADIWYARACAETHSEIQEEYYENSRHWQYKADQYEEMAERIAGKIRRYGDIQTSTASLFAETAGLRRELISALRDLSANGTRTAVTEIDQLDWKNSYMTFLGKSIRLSIQRRQKLKIMGITDEQLSRIFSKVRTTNDYRFLSLVTEGDYIAAFQTDPGGVSYEAIQGVLIYILCLSASGEEKEIQDLTNGILWTDESHYRNLTRPEEAAHGKEYLYEMSAVLLEELTGNAQLSLYGGLSEEAIEQYSLLLLVDSYLLSVLSLAFDQNEYRRITGQDVTPSDYRQHDLDDLTAKLSNRYLTGARIDGLTFTENGFSYQMQYQISEHGIIPDERCFWLDDPSETLFVKGGTYRSQSSIDQAMSRVSMESYVDQLEKLNSVYAYQWLTKKAGDHTDSLVEDTFNYDWKKALQHGTKLAVKDRTIKEVVGDVPIVWADICVHEWKYQESRKEYLKRIDTEQTRQQVKMYGEAAYYETTVGQGPYAEKEVHLTDLGIYDIHVMENMGEISRVGFEAFMEEVDTGNRVDTDLIVRIIKEAEDPNVRIYGNALLDGRVELLLRNQNGSEVWNAFSMIEQSYNEKTGPMEKLDLFSLLRGKYE